MYLFAKTGANVRRPLSVGTLIPLLTLLMTAHAPYNLAQTPTPSAPPAPPLYRAIQDRPDRLIAELPNRMLVVAQEVKTAPVFSAQVWVKAGSIHEQEFIGYGISHYLEHLASGGTTTTRAEAENNRLLSSIGAQTNAATGMDYVQYHINATREHAAVAVDLLSDWMRNAAIDPREFDRERTVILREFEMGRGEPARILWKLSQTARWERHPARHPTIGYQPWFEKITRDDVVKFHRRMYAPNNLIFVVAGDIDRRAIVEQVARLWVDLPAREVPRMRLPIETPAPGARVVTHHADLSAPRLRLSWPNVRMGQQGDYALDVLAVILGQGESSRLVRSVRDEQRRVNTVTAFNYSTHWGEAFFGVDAEVAVEPAGDPAAAADLAADAVVKQIKLLAERGVSEAELARARRKALADVALEAQSAEDIADRLARDLIGMKDPDYVRRWADAIQRVSAQEVQDTAKRFLVDERLTTLRLLPLKAGVKPVDLETPAADAATLPADAVVEEVDVDNRAITAAIAGRAAGDASPAVEFAPIRRVTLKNGLRVLMQRSTLVPAVSIQFYHLGGLLSDEPGKQGVAAAASAMRIKGTSTRNAQQIADAIESLGARMGTSAGDNSWFTTAQCLAGDFDAVLDLVADVTLNPAFPADQWETMRPRLVASIRRQSDEWFGELSEHFRRAYFPGHPWSTGALGLESVVAGLKTEDLSRFHGDHLGAEEAVLVVFGDIDPEAALPRIEAAFGKMPAKAHKPFNAPMPKAPTPALLQVETRKPLAAVQAAFGPGVVRNHPDFPALEVLRKVLSNFPSGWLDQELRGKSEGLVYAVWAGQKTGLAPGYFAAAFNCSPDKLGQATQAAAGVIARLRNEVVDADTLARAKTAVLSAQAIARQPLADRAAEAATNELYGLPTDAEARFEQAVRSLDAQGLQAVARRYLRQPVVVVLTHAKADQQALESAFKPLQD